MRVGFLGNICNNHYVVAKYLREMGIDAHLCYPAGVLQQSPTSEDPDLVIEDTEWLHPFKPNAGRFADPYSPPEGLLEKLRSFDVLHAHTEALLWAAASGIPYVFQPHGSEFVKFPFLPWTKGRFPYVRNPFAVRAGRRMQKAIAGAERVLLGWYDHNWTAGYALLDSAGTWDRIARLPLVMDTGRFRPGTESRVWPDPQIGEALDAFDLVVFMPMRQMFMPETVVQSGNKGNDIFYRALATLVRDRGAKVAAVIVDKEDFDTPAAKRMVTELGLESNVFWVPKMPRHAVIEWYQAADLVVDGLVAGALGSIAVESLACGTPVMMRMDAEGEDPLFLSPYEIYEELPPIVDVRDEIGIVDAILDLLVNRDALRDRGARAREWIMANVDGRVAAPRYLRIYEHVLAERSSPGVGAA